MAKLDRILFVPLILVILAISCYGDGMAGQTRERYRMTKEEAEKARIVVRSLREPHVRQRRDWWSNWPSTTIRPWWKSKTTTKLYWTNSWWRNAWSSTPRPWSLWNAWSSTPRPWSLWNTSPRPWSSWNSGNSWSSWSSSHFVSTTVIVGITVPVVIIIIIVVVLVVVFCCVRKNSTRNRAPVAYTTTSTAAGVQMRYNNPYGQPAGSYPMGLQAPAPPGSYPAQPMGFQPPANAPPGPMQPYYSGIQQPVYTPLVAPAGPPDTAAPPGGGAEQPVYTPLTVAAGPPTYQQLYSDVPPADK